MSAGKLFFSLALSSFLLTFSTPSSGQTSVPAVDADRNPLLAPGPVRIVLTDVKHDVSLPLRDLARVASGGEREPGEAEEVRIIPLRSGYKPADQPDPVLQRTAAVAISASSPTLINNFDGIGQGVFGTDIHVAPPDTNGAVGLTQYVQWVNISFAVFDKATGNILPNFPVAGNTLWTNFGGPCETNNDGDPIVMYDKLNDRWVFGQFAVRGPAGFLSTTLQCVAVSTSPDATGTYNRYAFQYDNKFDDYPKMAVWPDAYYVTFNMFNTSLTAFLGTDACAYDGNAMRNGQTATQICFQQAPTVGGVLPADVDGHTPPPPGSPNYMVEFDVNSLNLYKFHVDFANPSNSTFSSATNIPVAPFTPLCNGQGGCVPQPGTATQLDSLADRLMYRLAYRNFGDHESLVVNHSVAANSSSGVRWYEIQNPNGAPIVAQQSTFAPDSSFRWMGSIAMDEAGDIALGYSVSSSSVFPSIAFAGRTPSDPASTLGAETTIITGGGSQTCCTRNGTPLTRWGDYSALQVDPSDDCTFWYTTEYLKTSGVFNWNTRIASFKFPLCGLPDLTVSSTHSGNFTQGDASDTYTLTVSNVGPKQTDGTTVTVADTLPTGLTATAMSGTGWSCTLGTLTCTRGDVVGAQNSYPAITLTVKVANNAPGIVTNSVTVSGGGDQNTSNNTATDQTTVIQLGPDPSITKSHSVTFVEGQTGTYTINVKNVGLSPTDGTTVTVTDTLPTGLTLSANAATGTGWSCNNTSSSATCTRSDALASNNSYPAITLTVNVANDAPAVITNIATVSGGGDVNSLNNSSSDKTNISLRPDLTITKSHTGNFHQGQANATYTLTVSNVGGAQTSGVVSVTDTVPAGLNLSFASGFGWSCNAISAATVSCTRSDAVSPKGSYDPISLFVTVPNDAPASVTNTATVSGGGEVNTANDTASDPTTIEPSPDLTITKSHSPDPFVVAQSGAYTITVSNVGHANTSGAVTVTDPLPAGLTATAISATGWSCGSVPTTSVSCSRSDALAVSSSYSAITVTVSVNGGGGQVINNAFVSGGGEFNFTNDTASDVTNITGPVLAITKSHVGNFTVGQTGTYTITVSNVGQVATTASAVNVNDPLPQGMKATNITGIGWSCSGVATTFVNCTRSEVLQPANSYPPISLTVSVDGTVSSPTTNFVSVTGGGDLNTHNNSPGDTTIVNLPDLLITKSHTGNFSVGQTGATYTITVSNVGTIATAGGTLTVNDSLPLALVVNSASGTGWSCNAFSAFFMNCTRPANTLAPGSSYPPITLTVNVAPSPPLSVTNNVQMSGIGLANPSHSSASDVTTIVGFGINPITSNVTVTAGTSGTFSFFANLASNAGTISFSASGLPANAKATFSPTSITATGAVTMTVDTSGNGHTAALLPLGGFHKLTPYLAGVFAFVAALGIAANNRRTGRRLWLVTCICAVALVLFFAGCGGGGGSPPPPPPPVVPTPPGTYTITVTATSSNTSISPVNIPVTLNVK